LAISLAGSVELLRAVGHAADAEQVEARGKALFPILFFERKMEG
jgi:hypothetical protein